MNSHRIINPASSSRHVSMTCSSVLSSNCGNLLISHLPALAIDVNLLLLFYCRPQHPGVGTLCPHWGEGGHGGCPPAADTLREEWIVSCCEGLRALWLDWRAGGTNRGLWWVTGGTRCPSDWHPPVAATSTKESTLRLLCGPGGSFLLGGSAAESATTICRASIGNNGVKSRASVGNTRIGTIVFIFMPKIDILKLPESRGLVLLLFVWQVLWFNLWQDYVQPERKLPIST